MLQPGQVVFAVIAESSTNEPSRLVAASIGVAMPADPSHHGYISEHHSYGQNEVTSGEYAEDLAASMLATVLGVPFDPEKAWDERREQWLLSGDIVRTMNVTSTAECGDDGRWTTVVQRPSSPHSAVDVTFIVRTMSPERSHCSRRSSHAFSGSNGTPSTVASMDAARSSAYSPDVTSFWP